jgi:RNA polymerase sigma-70 factor (sigma-E family)
MEMVSASFDEFVSGNAARLLRTAYLMTSDAGEAEDLVQECLFQVARRWSRIVGMDEPLAYARKVLVRLAVRDAGRRSRRRTELATAAVEPVTEPISVDVMANREELRAALRSLTPRQRAVLVLRYYHDLSESQIAEVLGCTTGTVKSTTSRSLAQLRGSLDPLTLEAKERR